MIQRICRLISWLLAIPFDSGTENRISQLSRYPPCAQNCISKQIEGSGCEKSSFACLCANYRLLGQISACALPLCTAGDFNQSFFILKEDCNIANQTLKMDDFAFRVIGENNFSIHESHVRPNEALHGRNISASLTTTSATLTSESPTISATSSTNIPPTTSSTSPKLPEASNTPNTPTSTSKATSISAPPTNTVETLKPSTITSSSTHDPTLNTLSMNTIITSSSSTSLPTLSLTTATIRSPDPTFVPTVSSTPQPTILPCSDPSWQLSPETWRSLNVDLELQQRKSQWGGNAGTFIEFVANFTGIAGLHCGIDTPSTCNIPSCPELQQAGAQPWQYLVAAAVVEMNSLINVIHDGISAGTEDLTLVIIAMANDFYPWHNPETTTQKALPWIEAILSATLSFVPLLFPPASLFGRLGGEAGQSAAAFASGGLQTLAANSNPETSLLSNMESLGLFVKGAAMNATSVLETWSNTLYAGDKDASGKTIIDYLANGRFAFPYDIKSTNVETVYFQSVVSDVVNDQVISNSKTFVMCGDGSVPCNEKSYFAENGKSCCLYQLADNNTYIEPPEITKLESPTYDSINSSSVTASSLRTYILQGLSANQSDTNAFINSSLSSDLSDQAFIQGPSAPGIWTIPVCDVGSNKDWVSDYSALKMPCCCGPSCSETTEFFKKASIAGSKTVNQICKSQYPGFVAIGGGSRVQALYGLPAMVLGFSMLSGLW